MAEGGGGGKPQVKDEAAPAEATGVDEPEAEPLAAADAGLATEGQFASASVFRRACRPRAKGGGVAVGDAATGEETLEACAEVPTSCCERRPRTLLSIRFGRVRPIGARTGVVGPGAPAELESVVTFADEFRSLRERFRPMRSLALRSSWVGSPVPVCACDFSNCSGEPVDSMPSIPEPSTGVPDRGLTAF